MVTLGFAYVFLKERIIAFHWFAVSVVIAGIVVCTGTVGLIMDYLGS
jgi:drug/metabolite transporter (DMT)-like permease